MTEIIMELSEEELPDYVNALLDQNRELREENAALRTKNADLESRLLAELQEPPYNSMASLEAENAALREHVLAWQKSYKDWLDTRENGDFDPMVPPPPPEEQGRDEG